jgi:hypothetical protein
MQPLVEGFQFQGPSKIGKEENGERRTKEGKKIRERKKGSKDEN